MSQEKYKVEHATPSSRIGVAGIALGLVVLALAPYWGDRETLRLLAEIFTYVALASLWNLLAGYAGLVSVGQQAYVGLGGYVMFALAMIVGIHPILAILIAGPVAAVVAVPVAALMFRLRGAYFAIGTWVMAEVFRLVASQISVLGGGSGISLPAQVVIAMAPSRHLRDLEIYWLALALTVVVLAAIVALLRSRHGLALTAIRDNELAARSNGIDVTRVKFIVYVLTAFGTGLIGALIFLMKLRISPDTAFSVNDWTAVVIFITVIGGIGRIEGPIIGTVIFFVMRQTLSDLGSVYLLIMGAVAIAVMLFAPKGLWGLIAERFGWQVLPLQRRLVGTAEAMP
jgi:branched-chain amino acid transport system permease protein